MPNLQQLTVDQQALRQVQQHLLDLRYGTLTLIVQDGKLARVEKLEKCKLETE